jgi:hypothetical protein
MDRVRNEQTQINGKGYGMGLGSAVKKMLLQVLQA